LRKALTYAPIWDLINSLTANHVKDLRQLSR